MFVRVVRAVVLCCALVAVASGCGHAFQPRPLPAVARPPSPASWTKYASYPRSSCFAGAARDVAPMRFAPSIPIPAMPAIASAGQIVAETLGRFGDNSLIRAAHLTPIPEIVRGHYRGWVGPAPQPRHPLWLLLDVTGGEEPKPGADAAAIARYNRANWEASLFGAGIRDKLCLARAHPLIGWWSTGNLRGIFNAGAAIAERFPNPPRAALRRRAQIVAERRGFQLGVVQFVHPFQDAPIVVFRTNYKTRFAHDVIAIAKFLNPTTSAGGQTASTYEGFYLEGDDMNGEPFLVTTQTLRGEVSGSQWAWDPCFLPYPHGAQWNASPQC